LNKVFTQSQIDIPTVEQLQAWVNEWANTLPPQTILLLSGEVGAGKTQLVQCLVGAMGGDGSASPTYAVHNSYETKNSLVDHVDLYRLKDDEDLESTGFWDLFEQPQALVIVEWADRLQGEVWPPQWKQIHITIDKLADQQTRRLSIKEN
jgi:tRNA threonylcarbamoyladenosine biosynthesis protein TsaE